VEDVPVLEEDEELIEALEELSEGDLNRGLVIDGDRLVGFLSITDLARALETGGRRRRSVRGA
jgi:CBS domain-containing protein